MIVIPQKRSHAFSAVVAGTGELRCHPPAKSYITRRLADGKINPEALRCLKRHHPMTPTNANTPASAPALR